MPFFNLSNDTLTDFDIATSIKKNVVTLDITVNDLLLVKMV